MEIEIIKFGGNAMKTKGSRDHILDIVAKLAPKKVLVIVSAMGKAGFPYATDTLSELVKNESISKKELDRLISVGEVIASVVLSNELNTKKINSYALSMKEIGFTSDLNYGNGYVKELNNEYILNLFEEYDVLVCPGFVCLNEDDEPTTLGRGGSDLSAVLLSEVLDTKEVTLYKDVDGVYPFIPPIDNRVLPYKNISYDEQLALSDIHLDIVQKEAISEAKKVGITIHIKNFHTLKLGSSISSEESNNKVIGINTVNGELLIACSLPYVIKEELAPLFNKNHIYIKEERVETNKLILRIQNSQMFLARRLILMKYFLSKLN